MDINSWLSENYGDLQDSANKISGFNDLSQELLHYAIEQLLYKTNVQDIVDSGGANFYLVRIMLNSWRSTTSEFYRVYRRPSEQLDEKLYLEADEPNNEEEIYEKVCKIKDELNKLHWYEKELFTIFADESHNMSSLSRATGIPRTSISLTINRIRKHIKKRL